MTKTDAQRREMLAAIGLNPDAPALVAPPQHRPERKQAHLVPAGSDWTPQTIPVKDIEWDNALLDDFPALSDSACRNAAHNHVFALYKTPKGPHSSDRNKALWSEVGKFINRVRRERETGGHVRERIKTDTERNEIAMFLQSQGLTLDDIVALAQQAKQND